MRREVSTGHEGVTKIINKQSVTYRAKKGKRSKCFRSLLAAKNWRLFGEVQEAQTSNSPKFADVLTKYTECTFPHLERSTVDFKLSKQFFFKPLLGFRMDEITPNVLDDLIKAHKVTAVKRGKRYNFHRELQELKTIFNWYRENEDYKFHSPVLKRHKTLGIIKPVKVYKEKMSLDETMLFLKELYKISELMYDFALVQFFTAARVSEIAGLQKKSVDLEKNILTIQYTAVWKLSKEFWYLKDKPKNGEPRHCHITDEFKNALERRLEASSCTFVFQHNQTPLGYRKIQHTYNRALKNAGLYGKFKSTHILRHAMTDITRQEMNLDYAQAVTGHKSIKQTERYAGAPKRKQKEAVETVSRLFLEKEAN